MLRRDHDAIPHYPHLDGHPVNKPGQDHHVSLFNDFLKAQEYSLLISSIAPSGTHRTSYFTDSV